MIEVQIPKDIRKYEAKLVGPFTLRQLIAFIVGCVIAYFTYKVMSSLNLKEHAVPMCMLLASPALAMGYVKPYGMPMERFLQTAFITTVLAPAERKYKTKNTFKYAAIKQKAQSKKEYQKRLKKDKKLTASDSKYESFK